MVLITLQQVNCGSQYHFYMETQTAYAVPDEDECVTVYSANQLPTNVHKVVANALGIPMHSVRVITRRLGGAFGGKCSRASLVSFKFCLFLRLKLRFYIYYSLFPLLEHLSKSVKSNQVWLLVMIWHDEVDDGDMNS